MKFGMNIEDRKSLKFLYGSAPAYFETMPSALSALILESMKELDNFKSYIPKKY